MSCAVLLFSKLRGNAALQLVVCACVGYHEKSGITLLKLLANSPLRGSPPIGAELQSTFC